MLKTQKVILWPNNNAFHDWERKAQQLNQMGLNNNISTLLEKELNMEERIAGLDIADFLTRIPIEQFNADRTKHPP